LRSGQWTEQSALADYLEQRAHALAEPRLQKVVTRRQQEAQLRAARAKAQREAKLAAEQGAAQPHAPPPAPPPAPPLAPQQAPPQPAIAPAVGSAANDGGSDGGVIFGCKNETCVLQRLKRWSSPPQLSKTRAGVPLAAGSTSA
jgi:hypothetical protein